MIRLAWAGLILASIPASFFFTNVFLFRQAPRPGTSRPRMSVLIPARDEESLIGAALDSVLANEGVDLDIVVLDDSSEDRTAEIVREYAARDSRVRLIAGHPLPAGWSGKQHACFALSQEARTDLLCFLDADVSLEPDALARAAAFLDASRSELVSGFPREVTVTFLERLLLPMIHFVLLGFLPLAGMRNGNHPAFAAGCGQWMLARRPSYFKTGGHSAIRATLHDGIRLPALFRAAGLHTDIFDATDVAQCRMYRSAREVWDGLSKNAVEGIAAPQRIGFFTVLLAGGQLLPFALCGLGFFGRISPPAFRIAGVTAALTLVPRLVAAARYRQPWGAALLHPVGIAALLALQWYALIQHLRRRPASWKGRTYPEPEVPG